MQWWRRLTPRGRIVVLVGLALVAAGIALTDRDLFWLGSFACLLGAGAVILVSWPIRGLRHERVLPVSSVPVGTEFHVRLRLFSSGSGAPRMLHFEEVIPRAMGVRPRFTLSGGISAVGEEVGYRLVGSERGRFRIGPLLVRNVDPFGLARNDMAFASTTEIAVTPRVHELGRLQSGAAGASAELHSSRAGLVGQDDVLVREYRRGDDVRRVHWRSTARTGELMVRREEQSWQPSTRLLLDNRRCAHAGQGSKGSFEWGVSAAASAGLALLVSGSILELADADGARLSPEGDRSIRGQQLIDELTDVKLSRAEGLTAAVAFAGENRQQGSSIVAILGRLSSDDLAVLVDSLHGSGSAHAIILDVDSFAGLPADPAQRLRAAELSQRGWSVVVAGSGVSVPEAWRQLRDTAEGAG